MNLSIKLNVPAYKKTYAVYNAAQNTFENVIEYTTLDKNGVPDVITDEHQLLRTEKIKIAANIPAELIAKYVVNE